MPINDKVLQLYNAMKADGADVGTEQEFNDYFMAKGDQGYKNRKAVWDAFKADGADVGENYEEFAGWLGLKPVKTANGMGAGVGAALGKPSPVQPKQPQQPTTQPAPQGGYQPTWQEQWAADITTNRAEDAAINAPQPIVQQQANQQTYQQHVNKQAASLGRQGRVVEDDGSYITEDATRHNVLVDANKAQKQIQRDISAMNMAGMDQQIQGLLEERERLQSELDNTPADWVDQDGRVHQASEADKQRRASLEKELEANKQEVMGLANTEWYRNRREEQGRSSLEDIDRQMEQLGIRREKAEKDKSFFDKVSDVVSNITHPLSAFGLLPTQQEILEHAGYRGKELQEISKEENILEHRRDLTQEGLDLLNELRTEKGGGWQNLGLVTAGRNVRNTASKRNTWDFGAHELDRELTIAQAIMKQDNGQELTPNEKALLNDWAYNSAVSSQYSDQLSGWAKAGMVTGESLPFMLEMALNPMSGLGKSTTDKLVKYAVKRYGTKWVRDHMKGLVASKIATRAAADIVGSYGMATTTGIARTAADAVRRMKGEVDVDMDDKGDIIYKGVKQDTKENPAAAIFKALNNTAIENWSEMAGNYFGFVNNFFGNVLGKAVVGKAGRKMLNATGGIEGVTLNKAQKFIYELAAGKGIGAFSEGLAQFAKKTQWHGVVNEYLEEVIGNVVKATPLVGDMTFDTAENTGVFNLQQNIDTFCGVALMGGFMSALHTAGYAAHRVNYDLDKVNEANSKIFGEDLWGDIKTMIDNSYADPRELNNALTYVLRGDSGKQYSPEEKKAVLKYTQALLEKEGAEMVDYKPNMASSTIQEVNGEDGKKQWQVTSLDVNGGAITQQSFDNEDDAKAFETELKMQQQKKDYNDYLSMSTKLSFGEASQAVDDFLHDWVDDDKQEEALAQIDDPNTEIGKQFQEYKYERMLEKAKASQAAIAQFEEENGWTPGTVKWLAEQDPMRLDNEGLQMQDQARAFLEQLAYPPTEVHVEHEQKVGSEAGQQVVEQVVSTEEPIDPMNNIGKDIQDQWDAAQASRQAAFDKDERLKEEVERMEGMGLSPQEIISSLDWARPEQRQAMVDYYNAQAKYNSMVNAAANKINEEAAKSRQRNTFKGTINGSADLNNVYQITDGTNTYTLVSGNVTTNPATGEITDSTSGLIIGLDSNGEFVQLGDSEGYSVVQTGLTLDQFEEAERLRLQEETTTVIMPNGPQIQPQQEEQQTGEVGGEAGVANDTGANEPPTPESAIDRIPKDEGGNPLYEQASPEDTYDAFVEQVGENTARVLAKKQVDTATKALEKLNKKMEKGEFEGNTIQEQIASSQALQQQIAATQATINYWNQVLAVPNNRILNESNTQATATNNVQPAPETPAGEAPEWRYDTPEAARQRGYKVVEGQRIDRQEEKPMPQGMEVEVQFSTKDKVKGHMTVSELGDVQGSHLTNGQVNEKHFLPEAQPKAEFGQDRQAAAQMNASEENFRPELMLTFNGTQSAYSGSASQTNRRGEVIQGNGRRNLAEYIYAPGNEAVAQKYKTFLKAHAEELGTTPEAIDAMEKPFAHIVLDVTDDEAIRLGQFTAGDLETGGKKIPDVTPTVTKLGDNYGTFSNILLRHEDPDATLAERIEANMEDAVGWLNRGGYINNTEAKTLLEDKDAARQFFKDMLTDVLFKGAHPDLRTMFYELPRNIQSALVSVVGREVGYPPQVSLLKEIQESIQAYHELMTSSPQFAGVKGRNAEERYKAADSAVEDWLRQFNLDGSLNSGKYSNFALELAKLYVSLKDQKTLASRLNDYYDLVNGSTRELGMFDEPDQGVKLTKEQALEKIFGIQNGTERNVPVAGNNQGSQEGGEVRTDTTPSSEREEGEAGPAVSGGGSTVESPIGEQQVSEREQFIAEHPLTEEEIDAANASPAQKILAKQYLNSKDDFVSEMAKAAYTYIYNKKVAAQNQPQHGETQTEAPGKPRSEAPATEQPSGETPQGPTKPKTVQEIVEGYYEEAGEKEAAQAAARARMAAALAKLKKHGKNQSGNQTDAYKVENLTPEQLEDMFEVIEAGAELGYTLLDGVQTKEEWIAQMREAIAEPLKDATGYTDAEVTEVLEDMWGYPYAVEGQTKTVGEWAAEKGINVNEIENGTEQGQSASDNPSTELPGSGTLGNSTEVAVESGSNNEGDIGVSGENGIGTVVSGSNSGTQTRGQANRGGQRTGTTGSTRGKTRGTGKSAEPGNLFGEDNGNETNDTPGITTGGTAATVPESGIVVPKSEQESKKPLADITQEKAPYKPASIGGKYAIGSVIPSGIADSIANAFKRLKEKFFPKKGSTLDFVREELGYKTNEEMLSDFESGKTDGLAAEQVDAVALAIGKMKDGKSFIVGDMTGVGKGRTAAALIRWGLKHGKKVLFVTEKSGLFSDMYRDLTDIGCDYLPFVTNSDTDANITDADGNKVIPKPMPAAQKALWQSGSDKLPRDKKGRQYDFVMTTYSQVSGTEKGDKKKTEWLREFAKDAIVIMDESHNASGESNTGAYFREVVENAGGVTFLSATYAKRPDNMLLYAIKSSMSAINMPVQSFLEAIKEYGVAMQELMASALFGSGEMIRRERDMSDVKTTWTDPREIYTEEEYEECRKTSDKTMALINDIIQFQRDYVNPIVSDHEKEHEQGNMMAALIGAPQIHTTNTSYKSQVSNIVNLMVYAMKAKKAAEMAIEQIKQGKKPVIAVSNTMGSYIDELGDDIPEANFMPIFDKGVKFALKYVTATYEQGDDGKYHKVKGSEQIFDAEDELNDAGQRALENLRHRIEEYFADTDKVDLSLSPIDLVKQMIADAGYNCGEITGRSTQLVRKEDGGYQKTSIRQNKKEAARKFNGGSKDKPIPEDEQYQALILNVAGATGISLHSSKKFGNQEPRTMIILQPNADVNKEVQMRGRIDRTGQVHRGEYFYMSSPIPAEQKITMMLKQKLASLDAQSVGTKQVSSNKVEGQDMDNKYGDEVCFQYLLEHLNDVNAFLENGLQWNRKTREWEGRAGLLYDVLKDLQRMPCEMQEKVIAELSQRYADQIEYLNQNGINDLETTTMDLEAVVIDEATFVKGKDNESENEFAHDTAIERVEVNVLKKPMRSSDIKKKMKELDALDEDGLPKEGILEQTSDKVEEANKKKIEDRKAKYEEQEAKLEEKIRSEHPQKPDQTDESYEEMVKGWPSLLEMKNKHKADLEQYAADLGSQHSLIYRAAMWLKPGRPYLVPLTDDISDSAAMMYGRFLGFQMKNGDTRQVQAVFAVKDSRAMITIPVVNQNKVIEKIIQERYDMEIVSLEKNENGDRKTMAEMSKTWDEWWDRMIPKNTSRQVRYMITGNVLQACGSLGKYKGQIITFSRKNPQTGEVTLERGMLLAENFDPENFQVRRPVEKKDVWESYDEIKDDRSGVSCHREGSNMVVKFEKRKGEKLADHPAQKDQELKDLAMNGEIRPSGKTAILCVIKEDNVEKALEHLYKEYGYTKEELFVMPDSTEKPDAIVRTNRPWQEIINELSPKYGNNRYSVENKIRQMLKRYKMDVNNDDLKEQIREAVQLRQAYLRKEYADQESNRLAWEVLILDENIEKYKDDKDFREDQMRRREAILEELEYRGFKGNAYHYEQGKMTLDDVRKMFDAMNDESTQEGKAKKALFDKVMAKVSKLPMEIFLNEKIDNRTGGWAGGKVVNYNWKYMNADYIADQAKADTILHELIHTVTSYADRCVEDGLEHLLDQDMIDAINELHSIFDAIKNDDTFTHDGQRAYGLTNVREMLSEAGSNSEFRADLKKTGLWARLKAGFLAFFGIKKGVDMPGAKQVNAYDQIMERLDYLIENFKQEAWENYWAGTGMGGYGYKKQDAQKITTSDPMEAIEQAAESWKSEQKSKFTVGEYKSNRLEKMMGGGHADIMRDGKVIATMKRTPDGYKAITTDYKISTRVMPTEEDALKAIEEEMANAPKEHYTLEEAQAVVDELSKKYKPQVPISIVRSDADDVTLLRAFFSQRLIDSVIASGRQDEIKKIADNLRKVIDKDVSGKNAGGFVDYLGKIVIFADRLQKERYEEAYFHENIHAKLSKIYGETDENNVTPKREIAEKLWKKVPSNDTLKQRVIDHYKDENDRPEELFTYMLSNCMVDGDFSKIEKYLDESDKELLNNILNDLGYDRAREEKERRGGLGETKERNSQDESRQVRGLNSKTEIDPLKAIELAAKKFKGIQADMSDAKESVKQQYAETLDKEAYVWTEAWQDSMLALKVFQNAALKEGEQIADSQNAYMFENLMHGKNRNEMDLFNAEYRDPLMNTVQKIASKMGWSMKDVNQYLLTKSGLERNRELYVRDWFENERKKADADTDALDQLEQAWLGTKADAYSKLMSDPDYDYSNYLADLTTFIKKNIDKDYAPSEHDYSGLTAMFGEDYDEADVIAELLADEANIGSDLINGLWNGVNAANRYALERYREAGMRSDAEIDRIESMFNFYVPMRGFEMETGEDMYQYFTSKANANSYVGGLIKHAKGRESMAKSPLSTMFGMSYKAINDCNQNLMLQRFYLFCQAHPNDLTVLGDAWVKRDDVKEEWVETWPEIPDDATDEQARQAMLDYEDEMRQLSRDGKAKKIRGKAEFDYKPIDKKHKSEHTVEVRINGEKKLITIVGNPRLAQALNGHTRWENGRNIVSKVNANIKNMMSSAFTSYSPTFAARNMMRDWTHFRMMLSVREGEGYAHAAAKYYKETFPRPWHGKGKVGMVKLFKKYRKGTLDMSNEVERDFKDFMDNGGVTGYVQMQKIDKMEKELKKLIGDRSDAQNAADKAKYWLIDNLHLQGAINVTDKVWNAVIGLVEAYNEAVENNARFATYRASRHYAGRTKARSAYDAKEITVNFNRKGSGAKARNLKNSKGEVSLAAETAGLTSQVIGEGRIFNNATVQAIATTFKNFQNPDGSLNWPYIRKWAARYATPPFMFGLALPYINMALAAMIDGGDGDDDNPYANLPEWTRRKNLCIYVGDNSFITLPIGQELAAFLTLGDIMAGMTYEPDLRPVDKDWVDEMRGVLDTFSPIDLDTKVTNKEGLAGAGANVTARLSSVLAPVVAVGENLGWTGRPIYKEDKYANDEFKPEYQQVYQSTNPLLIKASKKLHEIGGGNDRARGKDWSEVNPAVVQYLWEQYTGGPGKLFSNTISLGKDAGDMAGQLLRGEPIDTDFNMRKVEGLKAFISQGDDRTEYYRAQSKFYKYERDANKFKYDYDLTNLEKQAKAKDPAAMMELDALKKTKEYARYEIIRNANHSDKKKGKVGLDEQRKEINKTTDRKEKREKQRVYNTLMKQTVDKIDELNETE